VKISATVLVVEDEEMLADFLEMFLTESGYNVVLSTSADTALNILDRLAVDVVFTDIITPGPMDGFQLADAIAEKYPQIPVICASGYPQRGGKEMAASVGPSCAKFLQKPYRIEDLVETIEKLLARRAAG
jgi:DNA-binding NtrC family response regulator